MILVPGFGQYVPKGLREIFKEELVEIFQEGLVKTFQQSYYIMFKLTLQFSWPSRLGP